MDETVRIELEVTREAAAALADEESRRRAGELLSRLLRPRSPGEDPLAALFADTTKRWREAGFSDEDIDAELAAYNAERRS